MTSKEYLISKAEHRRRRVVDIHGSSVDIFPLPVDEETLETLLRDLFENHWREITFGPIIQGAAYRAPTYIRTIDGYLPIALGASHFHICIGPHQGVPGNPASPALARYRRTSRAEHYRRTGLVGPAPFQRRGRAAVSADFLRTAIYAGGDLGQPADKASLTETSQTRCGRRTDWTSAA